jgi:sodium/proline symporter
MTTTIELWVFVIYLAGLLAIGLYCYKRTKDVEDYFVAGRGLGRWVLAFTHEASDLSGFLLLALPGFAYLYGMAGAWMVWTGTTGVLCVFAINAVAVRRLGQRYGAITLPDILAIRYGESDRHALRIVSVLIVVTCTFLYVSAQCIAAGRILELGFGVEYSTGVLIGGGVILVYTSMGGMRPVAWTDVVQGAVNIVGVTV